MSSVQANKSKPAEHLWMRVHNYWQSSAGRKRAFVFPDQTCEGPHNAPRWHAVIKIDGIEYGKGEGGTKIAAKEAAAKLTIERLNKEGVNVP